MIVFFLIVTGNQAILFFLPSIAVELENLSVGFVGPYIFWFLKTATGNYGSGLFVLIGCMLASGILAACLRIQNKECHEKER